MPRTRRSLRTTALALLTTLASTTAMADPEEAPLTLRPDNTVIIDGTTYAGRYLQWALLKCVAKTVDADAYELRAKPERDRSASPAFPLYRAREADQAPADRNVIAFGNTSYLSDADRTKVKENPGAILMRREGNVVIVAGRTPHDPWEGEMAVMSLLLNRVCGIRFYAPDPLWWSMPEGNEVVVHALDEFQEPAFAKTTWPGAWWPNYPHRWNRINRPLSEGADLKAGHSIVGYFKPEKYYDQYPQLYEMKRGKRPRPTGQAWNPCLSAKELPDIAMPEIRERMNNKRRPTYLSFGVMDCKFDCHCDPCQASVKQHGGSYSNLYYTFLNEVARRCQKEFPKLYLTSYIYSNVRRPPVDMKIEPNIVVDYVSKSYRWVDPEWARRVQKGILSWASLGAGWVIHDWSFGGITPRAYTRQFAQFLQWGKQHGMKGLYIEWSHYDNWVLDGGRYWIMRQLESNPYQNVDALWRQYCDDMYGSASETMYRFFQHFADKYTYADNYCHLEDWPKREFALYTEKDLDYQRTLIERARAATTGNPTITRRFDELRAFFRQHELWVRAVAEPSRLAHRYTDDETVNKAALAFYLNDDGAKLEEAIDCYREMHETDDPGTRKVYQKFEFLPAYAYNYSRGLGQILRPIKRQALAEVDLVAAGPETPKRLVDACHRILRSHLLDNSPQDSVKRIEGLLEKALWVPTRAKLPAFDGNLDDAAWEGTTELKDFSIRAVLLPSRHKARGRIMRVGDRLVVGLKCDQVGPIWASTPPETETGTRIWRESSVEFMFGPVGAEKVGRRFPFAQYIVNAKGAWRGFAMAEGNREGVTVAVRLDQEAGHYTIEAAFPLKAEGYDFTGEKVLSFNLMRNVYNADTDKALEIIGWAPIFYTARNAESRGLVFLGSQ